MRAARLHPARWGCCTTRSATASSSSRTRNEAIHAYTQATADAAYDACGAVNYNLGMAYASLHDYEDAVKHFEIAVSDAKYDASYKAYSGMGNALLKLGKSAEAGVAFREAALTRPTPDPPRRRCSTSACASWRSTVRPTPWPPMKARCSSTCSPTRRTSFGELGQVYGVADAEGRERLRRVHRRQDVLPQRLGQRRLPARNRRGRPGHVRDHSGHACGACRRPVRPDVAADGAPMYADEGAYAYGQPGTVLLRDPYGEQAYSGTPGAEDHFFNASDEELEQWSKWPGPTGPQAPQMWV